MPLVPKASPLKAAGNGMWVWRHNRRAHTFGSWKAGINHEDAIAEFLRQRDHILAGESPEPSGEAEHTVNDLVYEFLADFKQMVEDGRRDRTTLIAYTTTCDQMLDSLGETMPLRSLTPRHFRKLRQALENRRGHRGKKLTATSIASWIRFTKAVLNFVKNLDTTIHFESGKWLDPPQEREIREALNAREEKFFELTDIRRLLAISEPDLAAMVHGTQHWAS